MRDLYDAVGGPLYAVHANGNVHAIFGAPNQALAFMRGQDAKGRRLYHIENEKGDRVEVEGSLGHAHAILAALERTEKI
jgi:hypothetical protein